MSGGFGAYYEGDLQKWVSNCSSCPNLVRLTTVSTARFEGCIRTLRKTTDNERDFRDNDFNDIDTR
jgi:hypothetical protein